MHITPLTHPDLAALPALQPPDWSDVVPYFSEYINSDFCYPVKVVSESEIVGAGTTIVHGADAWLAHIIVHPEQRNKGIGRHLTQALLQSAQAQQCQRIYLIATDLGAPVYEKLGFITETNYLFYKNCTPNSSWEISRDIKPFTEKYSTQIAQIDKQVSGEDRFFHLRKYLSTGFVFVCNDTVEGFYLPDFGDGVILAITETAGTELMQLRLKTKNIACFPEENIAAKNLLQQLNCAPYKTAKRMRLGRPKIWAPQHIYNRIGGNLG